MPNRLVLTGFSELNAALAAFPKESRDRASAILGARAERARAAVVAAYPHGETGDLQAKVVAYERPGRDLAPVWVVDSQSDHAKFYEFGTIHERPHPTFLPITHDERRAAAGEVVDYVEAQGITVEGAHD